MSEPVHPVSSGHHRLLGSLGGGSTRVSGCDRGGIWASGCDCGGVRASGYERIGQPGQQISTLG